MRRTEENNRRKLKASHKKPNPFRSTHRKLKICLTSYRSCQHAEPQLLLHILHIITAHTSCMASCTSIHACTSYNLNAHDHNFIAHQYSMHIITYCTSCTSYAMECCAALMLRARERGRVRNLPAEFTDPLQLLSSLPALEQGARRPCTLPQSSLRVEAGAL